MLLPLVGQPLASAAPIDDKRAEAARLLDQLEAQGEEVSLLAERYNRARLKVDEVEAGIAETEADVARSDDRLKQVKDRLATAAVLAYMHGGSTSILSTMARSGVPNETIVRHQYLRVAANDQRSIIGELRLAKEDLSLRRAELDGERKAARAASNEAAAASHEAEAAQAEQAALLASVEGDISGLVAEETARREAADAEQRRLAAVIPPTAIRLAAPTATPAAATDDLPATRILPSSGLGAVAVDWAMQQLGKPYEYGGSGPDSFDCSGLTMRAWGAAGVEPLPRRRHPVVREHPGLGRRGHPRRPALLRRLGGGHPPRRHVHRRRADDRGVHHRHPHPHPRLALGRPRGSRPTGLRRADQQYLTSVGYGFS